MNDTSTAAQEFCEKCNTEITNSIRYYIGGHTICALCFGKSLSKYQNGKPKKLL